MTKDDVMDRLRRANPVEAQPRSDDRLFEAIVATPRPTGRRRASSRRSLPRLAGAAAALTLFTGVAWAGVSGALSLFGSNPQSDGASPGELWHQDVIGSSVVNASSLELSGVGRVQFWFGDARQGGWCGAVRLPGGSWAGTNGGAKDAGGTAPGCYPTRRQINADDPVYVINGFDYHEVAADGRGGGGSFWRIYYGVVAGKRPAVRVVDRVSGRSAPVHDGRAFAIAVPDPDPERRTSLPGSRLHLVAYDPAGEVVADERRGVAGR